MRTVSLAPRLPQALCLWLVLIGSGCEESVRYGSWAVARAPHPTWSPGATASASGPVEAWRSGPPPASAAQAAADWPSFQDTTFPNGARLLTLTRRTLPVVSVRIVAARGAADGPSVAPLVASMLFEGTAQDNGLGLRQALSEMGATFSASALYDAVVVDAMVPSANLLPAIELLLRAYRFSIFPEDELERIRALRVAKLERLEAEPSAIADRVLQEALYPPGNPYHSPAEGDVDSTRRITRGELVTWWQAVAVPALTTVIVVGDIESKRVARRLRTLTADWPGSPPGPQSAVPAVGPSRSPRVLVVDRPADSQWTLRIGWQVPDRANDDIPALRVLAAWLANDVTGRLDRVLRLEHWETYDVKSWVAPRRVASPFIIAASVDRKRGVNAVREVIAEVEHVRAGEGLSDRKSRDSRSLFVSGTWRSFETNGEGCVALTEPAIHREPVEAIVENLRALEAVRSEDIGRVAYQYLAPQSRVIVVLGDAAIVRPTLESAALGDVTLVSPRRPGG